MGYTENLNPSNSSTLEDKLNSFEICFNKLANDWQIYRCMNLILAESKKALLAFQDKAEISISPRTFSNNDFSVYKSSLSKVANDEEKSKELCEKFSAEILASMEDFITSVLGKLNKNLEAVKFEFISCSGGKCCGLEWDQENDSTHLLLNNFNFVITINSSASSEDILNIFENFFRKIALKQQLSRCMNIILAESKKALLSGENEVEIPISPRTFANNDFSSYRSALLKANSNAEKHKELCQKFSAEIITSMKDFITSVLEKLNKNLEAVKFEFISCSGAECHGLEWAEDNDFCRLLLSDFTFIITF